MAAGADNLDRGVFANVEGLAARTCFAVRGCFYILIRDVGGRTYVAVASAAVPCERTYWPTWLLQQGVGVGVAVELIDGSFTGS
jgi:hypothetical protein